MPGLGFISHARLGSHSTLLLTQASGDPVAEARSVEDMTADTPEYLNT